MSHPSLLFLDGHFETTPNYDLTDSDIHMILSYFPVLKAQDMRHSAPASRSLATWPDQMQTHFSKASPASRKIKTNFFTFITLSTLICPKIQQVRLSSPFSFLRQDLAQEPAGEQVVVGLHELSTQHVDEMTRDVMEVLVLHDREQVERKGLRQVLVATLRTLWTRWIAGVLLGAQPVQRTPDIIVDHQQLTATSTGTPATLVPPLSDTGE